MGMAHIYTTITDACMTVADLDPDFTLLTDSQDIESIHDHFGYAITAWETRNNELRSFFVKVGDGDYIAVYGCYYAYPLDDDILFEIKMIHS